MITYVTQDCNIALLYKYHRYVLQHNENLNLPSKKKQFKHRCLLYIHTLLTTTATFYHCTECYSIDSYLFSLCTGKTETSLKGNI